MSDENKTVSAPRIIDFKLPLSWLMTSATGVVFALGVAIVKLDQLGADVIELKATVRAGNATASTVQNEVAILRYRVETLEKENRK